MYSVCVLYVCVCSSFNCACCLCLFCVNGIYSSSANRICPNWALRHAWRLFASQLQLLHPQSRRWTFALSVNVDGVWRSVVYVYVCMFVKTFQRFNFLLVCWILRITVIHHNPSPLTTHLMSMPFEMLHLQYICVYVYLCVCGCVCVCDHMHWLLDCFASLLLIKF